MNTSIRKGFFGWEAETFVQVSGKQYLKLLTMKTHSGYLTTSVCGVIREGSWIQTGSDDWRKRLEMTDCRVTEKAVKLQHSRWEEKIPELIQEMKEFYGIK